MVNATVGTVLAMTLSATAAGAPLETAARAGAAAPRLPRTEEARTVAQTPPTPRTPPAPPTSPTPPPPPSEAQAAREAARAQATRDAARARARVQASRQRAARGPWVHAAGDPLSATFTAQTGDVVELVNTSGDVVVTAGGGRDGRIVARRKAGGRTEAEAQALLGQMRIEVTRHPQRIVVRGLPADKANAFRLDYEITLPAGVGVDVRNMAGDVRIDGVAGDVRVEAFSGDIVGNGLARVRSLRTMSGDITLAASTLVDEANLQTVSGDVMAIGLKAPALTLGSVSGDIQLKDAGCERVTIRTVNGDIEFASAAVKGGRYELKTHAGSILVLAGGRSAGFEYEARTFKGDIQTAGGQGQASTGSARQLSGRVGDGSAFFELTSFGGDIVIKR